MSDLGKLDWELIMRGAQAMQPRWVANGNQAAGASLSVRYQNPQSLVPLVGESDQKNFIGARIVFGPGAGDTLSANMGFSTTITAIASSVSSGVTTTTLTLSDAVPSTINNGDQFDIYAAQEITVTAPENIAQVGGAAVPTINGVPSLPVYRPVERVAFLSNVAVAANTNILTASLAPVIEGVYRVRYLVSAASTFAIVEINSATATTGASQPVIGTTQEGAALVAGAWYEVDFEVGPHETYNFQVGTACNLSMRVQFIAK